MSDRIGAIEDPATTDAARRLVGYVDAGPDVPAIRVVGSDAIRSQIEAGHPVWVDVENPAPRDLELVHELFGFHPLAIEDVEHAVQRPKVEEYEHYLFVVAFGVEEKGTSWKPLEVDMFLGDGYIVSFHEEPVASIARLAERCAAGKIAFDQGADRILHAILDGLVDGGFPLLDAYNEQVESIERRLLEGASSELLEDIFLVRKELLRLRRLLPGHREVLAHLSGAEQYRVSPAVRTYLRDVHDHVLRIMEGADMLRDMLATAVETYLSQVAERTNGVMKILAIIATLGLPLTVVTSFFGMNFERMPGVHNPSGAWIVLVAMVAAELLLIGLFRKKGWL